MLVGVPLGVISRRGGKSSGLVFTILLVLLYYFLSLHRHCARPPGQALAFPRRMDGQSAVCRGRQLSAVADGQRRPGLSAIANLVSRTPKPRLRTQSKRSSALTELLEKLQPRSVRIVSRGLFPRSSTSTSCANSSACSCWCWPSFVMLMLVFTFFELVGDILRNHIALATVGDYLFNLTPSMLYHDHAAGGADRGAGHIWRAQPQQRNRRHEGHRHQPLPPGGSRSSRSRAVLAICLFLFDDYYLPRQTAGRKRCAAPSRAGRRKPFCTPSKSGCSANPVPASRATSSTTSSSIRTTTRSPISRSSNSILPRSRSRGESLHRERSGMNRPKRGAFTTAG